MYHFVEISQSNAVIKALMEQGRKRFEAVENGVPFSPEIIDTSGLSIDGGIAVSYERSKFRESVACITDDVHILIIGATRSGKTRCLVIQSISALALAGEGMVVNDPKGELYHYTHSFLESMGYTGQVVDFNNLKKSCRYNPLQMIIDAVNDDRIDDAQSYTWDFVTFLVEKNDHSEPIWTNGKCSVIAAAVMCVVYDNQNHPEYQNLTNVYNFIANMCKTVNKVLPIDAYMDKLPDSHPAKKLMAIAKLAPDKMGGSFYTAALTTLRLFITNDIYSMTKAFVTTIVQIMLCKIGLSLMLNATIISASNIFWGIACMIAAISMPKILREFLVPTTGDGRIGTTVSQTVHIASMAKNIIAK